MAQPSTRRRAADLAALNAPSGPNWLPSTPRDGVSDSLPLNAVGAVAQTLNAARRPHRQRGRIDNDMVLSTPAGYRPHRPLSLSTPHRADVPLNAAAAPFSAPALYNAARQLPDAFNAWHFRSRCSTPCSASRRLQRSSWYALYALLPSTRPTAFIQLRAPRILAFPSTPARPAHLLNAGTRRHVRNDEPHSNCHPTPIDGRLTPSTRLRVIFTA